MRKKGWLIYRKQDAQYNRTFIDWFVEECRQQELELTLIYRESLTIGIRNNRLIAQLENELCQPPDFAVIRTVEPILNRQLEQIGVHVFNSANISELCNNKAYTHQALAQLNIPMVQTIFLKHDLLPELPPLPLPVVIKSTSGRGGKQVHMINNVEAWKQFIAQSFTTDFILQACDVQLGKDLRVFIVGKKIVGAVLRESSTDFRANYSLGGTASWYELNKAEYALVQSIVDSFDFGMVGIDFLFNTDGALLFNEIEDVVGSRTLSKVSNVNIVEKYVTLIKQQL